MIRKIKGMNVLKGSSGTIKRIPIEAAHASGQTAFDGSNFRYKAKISIKAKIKYRNKILIDSY